MKVLLINGSPHKFNLLLKERFCEPPTILFLEKISLQNFNLKLFLILNQFYNIIIILLSDFNIQIIFK